MQKSAFLTSNFDFEQSEYEVRLQHILFNSVLSTSIVVLAILSLVRFLEENFSQSLVDAIVMGFCIVLMFYIRLKKENVYKAISVILFLFFFLVSYSFINVNMHLVGASWFIVFLLPAFYLGSIKVGIFLAFLSLLSITVLGFNAEVPHTTFEYLYVIAPLTMSAFFLYIYEKRCMHIKNLLLERNLFLEREVEQRTKEKTKFFQKSKELADIVDNSNIEFYIIDAITNYYLYVNHGALESLGYSSEEMLQKTIFDINKSLKVDELAKLKELSKSTKNVMNLCHHTKKDGTTYAVYSSIHPIIYNNKAAFVIYDTKISDEEKAQEEILKQKELLSELANYDQLTKLPNRVLFHDRLSQAILKAKRSQTKFALFFIDLDKFKEINDSFGHGTGDIVLVETSRRLQHLFRDADTVARLSGDEFLAILENIKSEEDIANIAQKTVQLLAQPLEVAGETMYVTCSIGISIYPDHTNDSKMLLKHADEAMYKAKALGKNNFQFYTDKTSLV
jgi:diguanylate cyclase (GGDEF)-like protein/PAS domain S-box-containing protein